MQLHLASFENAKDNLKALKETQFKDNIKFDLATSIYQCMPMNGGTTNG